MLLDLVNQISSERKVKKNLDIQVRVLPRSSRGRPEKVLGTSRIKLPGTSLECQIKTPPGRHFRTSPGRQIGTSPERSNRIFRGRPGEVGGGTSSGYPGDQYLPAGILSIRIIYYLLCSSLKRIWNIFPPCIYCVKKFDYVVVISLKLLFFDILRMICYTDLKCGSINFQ